MWRAWRRHPSAGAGRLDNLRLAAPGATRRPSRRRAPAAAPKSAGCSAASRAGWWLRLGRGHRARGGRSLAGWRTHGRKRVQVGAQVRADRGGLLDGAGAARQRAPARAARRVQVAGCSMGQERLGGIELGMMLLDGQERLGSGVIGRSAQAGRGAARASGGARTRGSRLVSLLCA